MIIDGNKITADEGKVLQRIADKMTFGKELTLEYTYYIGGKRVNPPHLEVPTDYTEVYEVEVKDGLYAYVDELTYVAVKTAIVKLKYSNDDQIALMLNYEQNPEGYREAYEEMQSWREVAGEVAKRYGR